MSVPSEMHSIKSTLTCWKISFGSHMLNAVFTVFYKIYVLTYMTDAECNMFTLIFTCINWQCLQSWWSCSESYTRRSLPWPPSYIRSTRQSRYGETHINCTCIIEIIMCYQYLAQILNLLSLEFISVNKDLFATITSQFTGGKLVSSN